MIRLSTYLKQYKYVCCRIPAVAIATVANSMNNRVGDIVDIKVNGAVQKG